jgi:hypothetical protein
MSEQNKEEGDNASINSEEMDAEQLLTLLYIRLKQLDVEIRKEGITSAEYDKCKLVINELLIYIEREYDLPTMVDLIKVLSGEIGHPLGPLNKSITKKLVKLGWVHDKTADTVRPMNDEELIDLFR